MGLEWGTAQVGTHSDSKVDLDQSGRSLSQASIHSGGSQESGQWNLSPGRTYPEPVDSPREFKVVKINENANTDQSRIGFSNQYIFGYLVIYLFVAPCVQGKAQSAYPVKSTV